MCPESYIPRKFAAVFALGIVVIARRCSYEYIEFDCQFNPRKIIRTL